jgi:hypothetical protein
VVLFVCTVLFTVVWWNINHHRSNWLAIFIVLILLSILTAAYAARGLTRAAASLIRASAATSIRRNRTPGGAEPAPDHQPGMASVAIDRRAPWAKSLDWHQKGVCDEAMVTSPGRGRRVRLRTGVNVGDGTHDRFCGGEPGSAVVPGRLVLGQLDEIVPTRTRTHCDRVRDGHGPAWIRQRRRLHRELIPGQRPLRLAVSQELSGGD